MTEREKQTKELKEELGKYGYDIRNLPAWLIHKYLYLTSKQLDFGFLFGKEYVEEQLEYDDNKGEFPEYTEKQWEHALEHIYAEDEFEHIENFIRDVLMKLHSNYPNIYKGLEVQCLNDPF